MASSPPVRRYSGGCHCKAVRFEVTVRDHRALECNCSMCARLGFIHVIVPKADFDLAKGAGNLTTYSFHTHTALHTFCRTCGIKAFYTPRSHPHGVSVNLRCLDEGQARFTVEPFDGRNWEENIDAIR